MLCLFHMKEKKEEMKTDKELLLNEILEAKKSWEMSVAQFNEITHPEAIDYMTYQIKAAEKRYIYLLNLYKQQYNQSNYNKTYETEKSHILEEEIL